MTRDEPSLLCGSFAVEPGHPCFAGHFPGDPLVPGVLLLDHALALLATTRPGALVQEVSQLRFRVTVRPGETVEVRATSGRAETVSLEGLVGGRAVFSARLRLRPATGG